MTDNNGATKVYATGQVAEGKEIAATKGTNSLEGTAKVKLQVSYSGSLTSVAEVNAAWQATLAAVNVTISDESADTTYYTAEDEEVIGGTKQVGDVKVQGLKPGLKAAGAGLKFKTTSFGDPGTNSHQGSNTIVINFATGVLDDLVWTSSKAETPQTDDVSFYVAVKGINGYEQFATDTYTIGALAAAA